VLVQRRHIAAHHVGDVGQQLAAERAAGVGAGEVLGTKAACVEQGHGQRVAQCQGRGGAGGWRQIQRAGFLVDAGVEVNVGFCAPGRSFRCR
jgi:hypothetical protein